MFIIFFPGNNVWTFSPLEVDLSSPPPVVFASHATPSPSTCRTQNKGNWIIYIFKTHLHSFLLTRYPSYSSSILLTHLVLFLLNWPPSYQLTFLLALPPAYWNGRLLTNLDSFYLFPIPSNGLFPISLASFLLSLGLLILPWLSSCSPGHLSTHPNSFY